MGTALRRLAALALLGALASSDRVLALPDPPAQDGPAAAKKISLDHYLRGSITKLDGTWVEVHYDFADDGELLDFADFHPFVLDGVCKKSWVDGNLHIEGTGGIAWKPTLRRKVEAEMEVRIKLARDFGAWVAEERVSDHFECYSIYDQFFQNKDKRGSPKQHMIARFLPNAHDSKGDRAFRYLSRNPGPLVTPQKPFKFLFGYSAGDAWLDIDDAHMKGTDTWGDPLRGLRLGLYLIDNEAWLASLDIRGDLDPKWAEKEGIDLSLPVKPKGPRTGTRTPSGADIAAQQKIQAVRNGGDGAGALLPLIANTALLDEVRDDAAKAVEETGDIKLVPRLVAPMESADLLTRKLAGRIVTKLAGRSFGYAAEADEESRRRAVRSMLDWIEKNPAKFK